MAPLGKAISVGYTGQRPSDPATSVYAGTVDAEWTIKRYACIEHQARASAPHRDPIHVTSHFLQQTSVAPFEVWVRTLRQGRGLTNVLADLLQQGRARISVHLIFGTLSPVVRLGLSPTSGYARRHPLHVHPSIAVPTRMQQLWSFAHRVRWARDPDLRAHNRPDGPARTHSGSVGGGGLPWGAWFQLVDPAARITPAAIAFLVDTFPNLPNLLPRAERGGIVDGETWFPTVTMGIEYKAPIPPPSATHAARTVGLYASGTFWGEPQGRHDCYVEVWTAPSELEEGAPRDGWRESQFCLATSTQMALCLPMSANTKATATSNAESAKSRPKL
ncbi:thioesterase-like superfamily-domain-containing protein [Mycena pura]|uniref:Thioesterase-like superfamily-domain-containing protein n=1 Tax=Mycena pura TaxID=153505 RepID=A0AAD6VJJ3_9AGAR|nr:thioesterase-like superfamily-domain-containing protein [Mycena pura]